MASAWSAGALTAMENRFWASCWSVSPPTVTTEPGCAVRAALATGELDPGRWESYTKLQRELAHLERRLDKRLQAEAKKRWLKAAKAGRENMRLKGMR